LKKIVFQNMLISVCGKGISFLNMLYLASQLSKDEYGNYLYILLIFIYLPILHFGSMNGFAIEYPKYLNTKDEHTTQSLLGHFFYFSLFFNIFISLAFFILKLNLAVLTLLMILMFFNNVKFIDNVNIYFSSRLELEKANGIKFITELLIPSSVLVLFYFYRSFEIIFFAQAFASILGIILIFLVLKFKMPKLIIGKDLLIDNLKHLYKIGFFIFIIWVIDTLFKSLDRWFVAEFYSKGKLAEYGFSSNIASIIFLFSLSFISPYSQVLFREVSFSNWTEVKELLNRINRKILLSNIILTVLVVISYPVLTTYFIPKYKDSYYLLLTMIPASIILSQVNLYIYFMTSTYQSKKLLLFQLISLTNHLILNGVIIYFHLGIVFFSITSGITLFIYFLQLKIFVKKDLQEKLKKYEI